eukprot:7474837-Pyramimonas_sp.AAC.1
MALGVRTTKRASTRAQARTRSTHHPRAGRQQYRRLPASNNAIVAKNAPAYVKELPDLQADS